MISRSLLAFSLVLPLLVSVVHAEEINVSGSTSVAHIMDVLAEKYNQAHPEGYVAVQGIGSSAGITLVKKGISNIGMSSRYLTEVESDKSLNVIPIALDGLAVIVNNLNPVTNITRNQLYDVYKGRISNWKQLGGSDQKIAVVTREASSGSRYSFESLMGLTKIVNGRLVSDISSDNLVVNSNSMVKTLVNHNKQAIGFVSTGSIDRSVKAVEFEGVKVSNETIVNGKYQLSRPFLVLYQRDRTSDSVKSFIKFLTSLEAKSLIRE